MIPRPLLAAFACLAIGLLPASRVQAQSLDGIVALRLIDGGTSRDGIQRAALHFTLAKGWKTYWRSPGDAGIPPRFDWRGSGNLAGVAVIWPTPQVFDQNGMTSVGYAGELVLPLQLDPRNPAEPVRLRGAVEIGVCKDVCIPMTLDFDHVVNADAPVSPAITAALAQRPYTAREAGVRRVTCSFAPTADGLRIEAEVEMPSAGGREHAVIEPGNPQIWASEAHTARRGDTLTTSSDLVHVEGGAMLVDRSAVRITVIGARHAVDIHGCDAG